MHKGIYCLVLKNPACTIRIGALGLVTFRKGYHAYVGSALGPGGLLRVRRHVRLAQNGMGKPRWHIDYILTSNAFSLVAACCFETEERLECRLASLLAGLPVPGFGCSDCHCTSHLFSYERDPVPELTHAAIVLGLSAHNKTIKT